jgi:hypothetical protein
MNAWLPALLTGVGTALAGGIYSELKNLQKVIRELSERVARLEVRSNEK